MQLDTFTDAVEMARCAFFQHDRPAFLAALQQAKTAVPADSTVTGSLVEAETLFPSPDALKMVMQAVTGVVELHRQEVRQRVLQERQFRPYLGTFGLSTFEIDGQNNGLNAL